jgi:hypothetical protein
MKVSLATRVEAIALRRLILVGILVVLAMLGLFLTNISVSEATWYWSAMFPAFGLISLWHELTKPRREGSHLPRMIVRQVLHWLGPIIAVRIMFLELARGQMDADSVALVTLLLLATTSFLAGVNFEPGFIWIGGLLAFLTVAGTEFEAYLWGISGVAMIALALAIISAILLRRHRKAKRSPYSVSDIRPQEAVLSTSANDPSL